MTGISNEAEIFLGCVLIHGTWTAALQVYVPPSELRTGLKEREKVETVPCLFAEPTVLFPPLDRMVPLGPTHSTEGGSVMPGIAVTVHTRECSLRCRAFSPPRLLMLT